MEEDVEDPSDWRRVKAVKEDGLVEDIREDMGRCGKMWEVTNLLDFPVPDCSLSCGKRPFVGRRHF